MITRNPSRKNSREFFRGPDMTRGRHPKRALEKAQKIAENRGLVHYYEQGPGMIADFSITSPEYNAEVKIKRMGHIRCSLQWLEREAPEEIAGLKIYPSSQEISRELWIYSPEYFWRFFRVCDTVLVEFGRDGTPLPPKSPLPQLKPLISGTGPAAGTPVKADETHPPVIILSGTSPSGTTPVLVAGDTSAPSENTPPGSINPGQDPSFAK